MGETTPRVQRSARGIWRLVHYLKDSVHISLRDAVKNLGFIPGLDKVEKRLLSVAALSQPFVDAAPSRSGTRPPKWSRLCGVDGVYPGMITTTAPDAAQAHRNGLVTFLQV